MKIIKTRQVRFIIKEKSIVLYINSRLAGLDVVGGTEEATGIVVAFER